LTFALVCLCSSVPKRIPYELAADVQVHGSQRSGAGPFNTLIVIGADCRQWPGSSLVSYSYLDLAPCLWNNGGYLAFSNSTESCGGDFSASCANCSLSDQVAHQINLTCSCFAGGAENKVLTSSAELSMLYRSPQTCRMHLGCE
jgi:CVNH domain